MDGTRWRWLGVDGAEWRWVHGLVIPFLYYVTFRAKDFSPSLNSSFI